MFTKPKSKTKLQIEIDKLVLALGDQEPTSEEYGTIVERLSKLKKLEDDTESSTTFPSADTLIIAATNLLGIALIIRHENLNVITSKALSFVQKPPSIRS